MAELTGWQKIAREIGDYDSDTKYIGNGDYVGDMQRVTDNHYVGDWLPAEAAAKEIKRLREALGRIAKPTYGTELADTDEERAKHYWTLLQVMQHIARKALDAAKEQP